MSDKLGRQMSPIVERNKQLRDDLNVSVNDKVSQVRSDYDK